MPYLYANKPQKRDMSFYLNLTILPLNFDICARDIKYLYNSEWLFFL